MVIGESEFEAQAGPIIVSGYSGVTGRMLRFDGVLFNLRPLANEGLEMLSISRCLNHW